MQRAARALRKSPPQLAGASARPSAHPTALQAMPAGSEARGERSRVGRLRPRYVRVQMPCVSSLLSEASEGTTGVLSVLSAQESLPVLPSRVPPLLRCFELEEQMFVHQEFRGSLSVATPSPPQSRGPGLHSWQCLKASSPDHPKLHPPETHSGSPETP